MKKPTARVLAILLCCIMAFALFACNSSTPNNSTPPSASNPPAPSTPADTGTAPTDTGTPSTPPPAAKDTLNIAITQDSGSLDPMFLLGYDSLNAMTCVYEPLWDFDADGNMVYRLATNLDMSNPTAWIVTVRQGVKFANGDVMDANDVLFSIFRGNNREGQPPYLPNLDMDKSKVIDNYTVELDFTKFDLSYTAGMAGEYIFDSKNFDENAMATTPNGTGPYVLSDYVINSHISLTARDDYWGGQAKIKNLNFVVLAEESQRVNALQTGSVDICGNVPYQDIDFAKTIPGYNVDVVPAAGAMTKALYFNISPNSLNKTFYDNVDARKAVAMAVDPDAILNLAFYGYGVVSKAPVSSYCTDFDPALNGMGIYGTGYDPTAAKALAESSGLVNDQMVMITNGSAVDVVIAQLIQQNLKDIGVTVTVKNLDPGSWTSYVFDPTTFDMAIDFESAPAMKVAQQLSTWTLFGTGGQYTMGPWDGSDTIVPMLQLIMTVTDPATLADQSTQALKANVDNMLWFSLIDTSVANAYNSSLLNYTPMLGGNIQYWNLAWA